MEERLIAWKRRLLAYGVPAAILALLGAALFLWGRRTEHQLCLCARCGARIVIRQRFFDLRFESFHAPEGTPLSANEVTTRPSILSELFASALPCGHGLFPEDHTGFVTKPKGRRSLIFLDSFVDTPLRRYGYYSHTTWTDFKCSCFFAPDDPVPAWNALDRTKFREFLLDKKRREAGFAERLHNDLQTRTKTPWDCAKSLLDEFARHDNKPQTTGNKQ